MVKVKHLKLFNIKSYEFYIKNEDVIYILYLFKMNNLSMFVLHMIEIVFVVYYFYRVRL
jgi:hypothetical protein